MAGTAEAITVRPYGNLQCMIHPGMPYRQPDRYGSPECTWRTIRRGRTCSTQRHNPENATSPVGAELARPEPVTPQKTMHSRSGHNPTPPLRKQRK